MKIDFDLFKEALKKQNGDKAVFLPSLPKKYALWIEFISVPVELKEFLKYLCLKKEFGLGSSTIFTPEQIIKEYEDLPSIFTAGFLIFGSSGNGDMLAIEYKKGSGHTGYLSHEHLWGWGYRDPYDYFLYVSESVGKFALKAVGYWDCPIDYFGDLPEEEK